MQLRVVTQNNLHSLNCSLVFAKTCQIIKLVLAVQQKYVYVLLLSDDFIIYS